MLILQLHLRRVDCQASQPHLLVGLQQLLLRLRDEHLRPLAAVGVSHFEFAPRDVLQLVGAVR